MTAPATAPATFVEFLEAAGLTEADVAEGWISGDLATRARHVARLHRDEAQAIVTRAKTAGRGLLASEARRFDHHLAQCERLNELAQRPTRSALVGAEHTRDALARGVGNRGEGSGVGGWMHVDGGRVYERGGRESWIRDMATVALNRDGADEARDRLQRNQREVQIEHRALNATDGSGGDFVPPLWIVDQYIALARASRPVADRVRREPLPPGTDTINVPRIATGTAVAEQVTQNTTIQNTDATTGTASGSVATLAGGQTISVQMLEQSPINVDDMLLQDLLADLAAKVDLFVLNNNAAGKLGILNTPGANAQTYTSATPTTKLLYSQVAQAIAAVQTNRFASPDTIIMAPRRWAALLTAMDTANRPLVTPYAGLNAIGQAAPTPTTGGVVGQLQGCDVITDPLVPLNLGAGANQDVVVVMKADDFVLYESVPRAEAFRDTKADSLSIYLRVYNYLAVLSRFPKSISIISGTGLVPPAFDGS